MDAKEINLLEYSYPDGVKVEIPGRMIEGLMQFLRTVQQNETSMAFTNSYPTKFKEIFAKENKEFLEKVEVDYKPYPTAESFFSQTPQAVTSVLGAGAQDLLMLLQQAHLDNIEKGVAVKRGTVKEDESPLKLVK